MPRLTLTLGALCLLLAAPAAVAQEAPLPSYVLVEYDCGTADISRALALMQQAQPHFQAAVDAAGAGGYGVQYRAYGGGASIIAYFAAASIVDAMSLATDVGRRVQADMPQEQAEFYRLCPTQRESITTTAMQGVAQQGN
jgi:hypothetical protein